MWSSATSDIGHAQKSYLTVAPLSVAQWRSGLTHQFEKIQRIAFQ